MCSAGGGRPGPGLRNTVLRQKYILVFDFRTTLMKGLMQAWR